jgi:hypothetical protein
MTICALLLMAATALATLCAAELAAARPAASAA